MAYDTPSPVQPEAGKEPEKIDAGEPDAAINIGDMMAMKERTEKLIHDREEVIHKQAPVGPIENSVESLIDPGQDVDQYQDETKTAKYKRVITEIVKALDSNPACMVRWRGWMGKELLREIELILDNRL